MATPEFLGAIVRLLDDTGIPHMVAGSVASSHHGEPRSTQDIDFVIDPTKPQLSQFLARLDPRRFYFNDGVGALERRDMFNVIEPTTGIKADLIIRKLRPFSESEFSRRERVEILGVMTAVATVEDMILAKLEWAQSSESERQLRDVAAMMRVHPAGLDLTYLRRWADELGVRVPLEQLLASERPMRNKENDDRRG